MQLDIIGFRGDDTANRYLDHRLVSRQRLCWTRPPRAFLGLKLLTVNLHPSGLTGLMHEVHLSEVGVGPLVASIWHATPAQEEGHGSTVCTDAVLGPGVMP